MKNWPNGLEQHHFIEISSRRKREKEALLQAAGEIVNTILDEHEVVPVDEAILKQGYDIIHAYETKYA